MSAQAGIWNVDGRPVDVRLLNEMGESLNRYGPDGQFSYVKGPIGLLYRPFYTTQESRREMQPFESRRGFVLTWDGRLDNREDLIAELRSDLGSAPTDIDIVACSFDRWEAKCFARFVGDWAVSVWSAADRQLTMACDYMAIRHIFFYLAKTKIWWATDLAPLVLFAGHKFQIDDSYVAGYFANDPDSSLTPYREIHQVPAGKFVRVTNGIVSIERYWQFSPKTRINYRTDAEYEDHFRNVFRQSVRRRLRSDSPILAELSGGLDSSSIVCMADDILKKEAAQVPRVDTLSYYDKTEPKGDDWIYFPRVEEKRGRKGVHIDVSNLSISAPSLVYEEFAALPGFLGTQRGIRSERDAAMANGGYRVVLSGLGGDEFMGGVPNPNAQLADLIVLFKFISLAKQLMVWSLIKRRPWVQLLVDVFLDLMPVSLGRYFTKLAKVEPWIDKRFSKRTKIAIQQLDVDEHFGLLLPTRRSLITAVLMFANKMSKQVLSSDVPREMRYPYLDQNLIEFVLSVTSAQLLRPGERRSLMRRAMSGIVPAEILSRRTKQIGARTPIVSLESKTKDLEIVFDSPLSEGLGYINGRVFLDKLHAARMGKEVHIVRLLKTVSLELWLRDLTNRGLVNIGASPALSLGTNSVRVNA